nr:MAG TPA: hypothetical protein [Caudoviricetes sp.]
MKPTPRILCGIALALLLPFALGFFTLGVWSIYGRTIAFWAMAALCVGMVAYGARKR